MVLAQNDQKYENHCIKKEQHTKTPEIKIINTNYIRYTVHT